jgi:hypothetical protein
MKYLEKYNDTYLANAPKEDIVKDWFMAEFEGNKYCDVENITVTRGAYNMRKGIRFYQYKVILLQDFSKSSDILANKSTKSVENFNDITLNKMERKYSIIINEHMVKFKSYSEVETTISFYFSDPISFHN